MNSFQRTVFIFFKIYKRLHYYVSAYYYSTKAKFIFYINGVSFKNIKSFGTPIVYMSKNARCKIGANLTMNNGHKFNPIGRNGPCYIIVNKNGNLEIGENVGISSTAIVCEQKIIIGNNVMLGGGVCIYDTDFHSLNSDFRNNLENDKAHTKTEPVLIEDNVFVGAHSTILKGVTIGKNSIVGACSVVTKSIPSGQIWAGNPARFIRYTD